MHVVVIETPPLGDRSYLVHDGEVALVVDPQRDVDRVEQAARDAGVRITHVAETHIHNDYLTGGLELARRTGAAYLVNTADPVAYERVPVEHGETIMVGRMAVDVVATPGHTHTHLAYVARDGDEQAVFSGGSLLHGSVGRTDLLGADDAAGLARAQHASVRRLAEHAGPDAVLYPTHGFGSFCAAGPSTGTGPGATIADEAQHNHALLEPDVERFVDGLLAGFTAYPTYYAHMGAANLGGPEAPVLGVPEPLDPAALRDRLAAGEWVVDLRSRVAFAADHLTGTASFEYGDGGSFTSFLGWVLPYRAGLTLLGTRDDVERAVRDLARIGFDEPTVALGDGPAEVGPGLPTASYPQLTWAEAVVGRRPEDVVLDVRRTDEFAAGHVPGAVSMPLHDVLARMAELPRERRVLVHCAAGYRAGIAASLLARAGLDVVHVDDAFANAPVDG